MSKFRITIERDNGSYDKYNKYDTIYEQTIEAESTSIQDVIAKINQSWSLDRPSESVESAPNLLDKGEGAE